jgi:DNA-3-methyladenine glycosylase I
MPPQEGPPRIKPENLSGYFEVMTKAVFQSGISWRVVEAKWDGFRAALKGFDPSKVADLTPRDVDRLTEDASIIRNRKKIEATVENAETMLALDREHSGFDRYLRSHGGFDETVADLRKRFRFLGDTGSYYFLYCVGEKVPGHDQWAESRGVDPETMRPKPKRSR